MIPPKPMDLNPTPLEILILLVVSRIYARMQYKST